MLADGRWFNADAIPHLASVQCLVLGGTARDLELIAVNWQPVMRRGCLGTGTSGGCSGIVNVVSQARCHAH